MKKVFLILGLLLAGCAPEPPKPETAIPLQPKLIDPLNPPVPPAPQVFPKAPESPKAP
jgi:hypothetical protein